MESESLKKIRKFENPKMSFSLEEELKSGFVSWRIIDRDRPVRYGTFLFNKATRIIDLENYLRKLQPPLYICEKRSVTNISNGDWYPITSYAMISDIVRFENLMSRCEATDLLLDFYSN